MTKQEMWEAVKTSDANYDGLFFYGVKTTGIFCRPSCQSKVPKQENILYFRSSEEARKAGFRPCKRCRSDLLEYQPMQEIAEEIRKKLDQAAVAQEAPDLEEVGLTSRRITDIFKQEYGMTPREYTDSLRLRAAKKMLVETDKKIIEIAWDAGFSSLSSFNRFFKKKTGMTPTEYRKISRKDNTKTE